MTLQYPGLAEETRCTVGFPNGLKFPKTMTTLALPASESQVRLRVYIYLTSVLSEAVV